MFGITRSVSHAGTRLPFVRAVVLTSVLLSGPALASAQQPVLVAMDRLAPRELRSAAFVLPQAGTVAIAATGAGPRAGRQIRIGPISFDTDDWSGTDYWRGNAWILNARTRAVVWDLSSAARNEDDALRSFKGDVQLEAGAYEVYFASYSGRQRNSVVSWVSRSKRAQYDDDGLSEKFSLTVRGPGQRGEAARVREEFNRGVVVYLPGRRAETQRIGFTLAKPVEVEIYAVGEADEDVAFDYGWIINADTRERVWRLDERTSEPAGGAEKNRISRRVRTLPAGRYAAFYAMDDSHDAGEWNAAPPYDPAYWGLTVRVRNAADRNAVQTYAYQATATPNAIVALTGLHDNVSRSYGFTLSKPMDVRVYALGEGRDGEMYDYGWITNAATRKRVWEMQYHETENAGGDEKNRLADRVVHLEPGSYLVSFVTDGSHSYGAWNAGAPMDGEYWGITLLPAGPAFDRAALAAYDPKSDPSVLARLERMRDGQERRVRFKLSAPADVRVSALGEGTDGEMHDYGWIEDAESGRTVWEMTYSRTQHAGGADKNRVSDETVRLPAGEYVLRYRTDESHAFGNWNDDPPEDAAGWGITVYRGTR